MTMFLIKKADVGKIAQELSREYQVYGPMIEKGSGQTFFDRAEDLAEINLSAPIPSNPPKSVVFPQMERILSYEYDRAKIRSRWSPITRSYPGRLWGFALRSGRHALPGPLLHGAGVR